MDAFDLLGLPPAFDLDTKLLEQRYRDLQRALHPDRFAQAPASERRASLARAVSVNEAYRLLRDDLSRAELLLARHAGESPARPAQTADPALLMEVMELREQLAEAKHDRDAEKRDRLRAHVALEHEAQLETLRTSFPKLAEGDLTAREPAARALARLRYYRRFLDEVARLEDDGHD